jgi:hypothetical protein
MKKVIILIISHKEVLSEYEVISLQQCHKILSHYNIKFICPEGLNINGYNAQLGFEPKFHFINPKWQSTYNLFNRLKISPLLYNSFHDYEYILFYEPDVFVFKDELEYWCNKEYDYIGAPWLSGKGEANHDSPYIGVGNGGFSLRKVSSHLKTTQSIGRIKTTSEYWKYYLRMNWKGKIYHFPNHFFNFVFKNNFYHLLNDFSDYEDDFWSNYVHRKFKWFKVAPVKEALKFSMEVHPSRMYADNNNELPFGCHAWWKNDLEFWKPHIEAFGYEIPKGQ